MPEPDVAANSGAIGATAVAVAAPPPVPLPHASKAAPRRSFLKQTLHDTFRRAGARMGATWIAFIAFLGVIAPLVANTHPFLMKADGKWSSPMAEYLTPGDVVLLVGAVALSVAVFRRKQQSAFASLAIVAVTLIVATPLAFAFRKPPESVNYQKYRDLERQGRVQYIVRTLIPYSPTDRVRDIPDARLAPPSWFGPIKRVLHGIAPGRFDGPREEDLAKLAKLPAWSLLGTETDGADLASRMIHATRIALSVGLISTSISLFIGCVIGGLMGYFVGWVDLIGMRLIEIFEAIPTFLVLITIVAAWRSNPYVSVLYLMMAVIGALSWTGTARFIRAEFLRLRNLDFVHAAVATGVRKTAIIYRHVLPNALTPVLVTATFGVASAILTEATLSFLGLGLVDEPSWGQMLQQARSGGQGFVWWMAIFPGLAIFLTVYAYALIGDAVRDALDPKLKKRD